MRSRNRITIRIRMGNGETIANIFQYTAKGRIKRAKDWREE